MKRTIVIGAGVAGLSAAACLAQAGHEVTVLEKNESPGGRARKFSAAGFTFDMGPSWYWMPDVFEKFFNRFGKSASDYYELRRLDPSYRVYYGENDYSDIPAGLPQLCDFFNSVEKGSGIQLLKFLQEGKRKYELGMQQLVYKPGLSLRELLDPRILSGIFRLHILQSLSRYVRKFFRNPRLINMLEFPVLFLGAAPDNTPALYSLMNYADMSLGTWYPMGGMSKIIDAQVALCVDQGVKFVFNAPVIRVEIAENITTGVWTSDDFYPADGVIASADYRHVEKDLLPDASAQYTEAYWERRVMAPSCIIFYLGVNKRISNLQHHTLFFDEDITPHLKDIYHTPQWPVAPQFYACCPSKTDEHVAPPGCENLFILIPVATGLDDTDEVRARYFEIVISRIERLTGEKFRDHIAFKRSYAHRDFISDYNAFKGNAYGLANTLWQTANLKPRVSNKHVHNLFYAGQLTVPGPGLPPALISGQVTADTMIDYLNA